jgi:hypothetical protein
MAIIALLIALVLWLGKKEAVETPMAVSSETHVAPPAVATITPSGAPIQTNLSIAKASPSQPIPVPPAESKEMQMREGLAVFNDEDIKFYGKALDQYGSPVANATVAGSVRVNNGTRVGVDRFTLTTDENGSFTVKGYTGVNLGIWITKSGYVMATTDTSFTYSHLWPESQRYRPDQNNPTVIKMWRLQGAEPLVDISKEYRLPYAELPIYFDFIAGKVVPSGGDLEAVITRTVGSLSKRSPGDWSIELKPVDVGIIESDYQAAQLTFEAPADGYGMNYLVHMNHDDPAWHDGIDREFFFKSRNGQVYGKLYLVFGINREPDDLLYFQFKGVANANSSRNWEATAPQ